MSQADIETLRTMYEAVNRETGIPPFVQSTLTSNTRCRNATSWLERIAGVEKARRALEEELEAFEDPVTLPEEFVGQADRIVVFVRVRSRPRGSSVAMEIRAAHVWTMRDGKAARCELFPVREEALEAVGLSE